MCLVFFTYCIGTQDQLSHYKERSESLLVKKQILEVRVDDLDKQLEEAKNTNDQLKSQKVDLQEQLETFLQGGRFVV